MWLLAWRNLWRNRARTGITLTAIALSLGLQLISMGVADSMYGKMIDGAVRTAGGDVLIHGAGYWTSRGSDLLVPSAAPILAVADAHPEVRVAIPRIVMSGIVRSARQSAGARVVGIDRAREAQLDDVSRHLVEGEFLGDNVTDPIVLGRELVDDLDLKIGKRVVVLTTAPDGETVRALFHLGGVVATGSATFDAHLAYVRLDGARGALGLEGDAVTQIGVVLHDSDQRHAVRGALVAELGARAKDHEALTWDEAMPEMVTFIEIDAGSNEVFGYVIFLVVAFGIANTFLMAVLERIREFGLLGALGLRPRRIAGLVLRETLMLGLIGIFIGVALGYAGHLAIDAYGIDYAELTGASDMEMSGVILDEMVIRSVVQPARWFTAAAVVFGLVVLSSLYPAWRATRLSPAEAMRTFE